MQTTEVTQEQWIGVMSANPSHFKGRSNPVDSVSWDDIQVLLKALNDREGCSGCYRLPSEAEWGYAYRAGTKGTYYWGDEADAIGQYAWYDKYSDYQAHPVGQFKPNAWGLYDMAGNVEEWVQDCYPKSKSYSGAPSDGSALTESCFPDFGGEVFRMRRGGDFRSKPDSFRAASRGFTTARHSGYSLGFRMVRVVSARTP